LFTGIIEELGEVVGLSRSADAATITVRAGRVLDGTRHGDSIAVSGVCLTVIEQDADSFTADVMAETLHRTTIGGLEPGRPVNLERSVQPTTRLGGHLVQGHVDGVGTLVDRVTHPAYDEIRVRVPREVGRYIAPKGAVALDGISLTVIDVADGETDGSATTDFTIGVIPETRAATTLGATAVGESLNIEADVMAKYVERLLGPGTVGLAGTLSAISPVRGSGDRTTLGGAS
jgi:riboflavin synthase